MDIRQFGMLNGTPEINIFDSHHIRYLTGGVTIDRETVPEDADKKRIVRIGTILGKITATGYYGPYDPAAADGRGKACCIIVSSVDCTEYNQFTGAVDGARILLDRLPRKYTQAELDAILADFSSLGLAISFVGGREVPGPKATDVSLLPATNNVAVGATVLLSPVFSPINTVDKRGTFESSNPAVATVDQNGKVFGVAAGAVNITFKTTTGGFAPTATVTVA